MEGIAFLVDGHFVQVLLADPTEFSNTNDSPETVLQKYRGWEKNHWEKLLKHELNPEIIENEIDSETAVSLWQITIPEGASKRIKLDPNRNNSVKNLWATRVVGNLVVIISMPVLKKDNESEVISLFQRISNTITKYDEPLDPIKIQQEHRK